MTNRVGRPRSRGPQNPGRTAREEILDAAAALFGEAGYAATSTRAIADRVGIRQASLYYHFAGKDEILLELLEASVRPTLDVVDALRSAAPDAATALHALAVVDVGTLLGGPLGIAALYVAPEVQQPRFQQFLDHRGQLRDVYRDLTAAAAAPGHPVDAAVMGSACLHLVEMATTLPRGSETAPQVALLCLATAGVSGRAAQRAASASTVLRAELAATAGALGGQPRPLTGS